jgi:hypothetical protein
VPLKPQELARKRIALRDASGAREELTLWLSVPYQKETDGVINWHVDWGIIGLLDRAREFVGPTPFDALVANLESMRDHLKSHLRKREIIDLDVEHIQKQAPAAIAEGEAVVTLAGLFGSS